MPCRLFALSVLLLSACGGSAPPPQPLSRTAIVDPAALYCTGLGGSVIRATSRGRRADLCRLPDGRTVMAADLINRDNDL